MKYLFRSLLLPGLVAATTLTAPAQAPAPFTGYSGARWPDKATPDSENYKLSHDDFVTRYGVTDTAAAIIHMYLRKHGAGLLTTRIVGGLTAAAGAVAGAVADVETTNAGKQVDATNRTYPSWTAPVITVGAGGTFFGLYEAARWSRKECYRVLYQFHTTRVLPPKVRHRLTSFLIKTRNHEFED